MTKHKLFLEHFQGYFQDYKLMAPNLFDYLQLVDFVKDNKSYFYNISPDKQTLTIYVYVSDYKVNELIELLPTGIVMERD